MLSLVEHHLFKPMTFYNFFLVISEQREHSSSIHILGYVGLYLLKRIMMSAWHIIKHSEVDVSSSIILSSSACELF